MLPIPAALSGSESINIRVVHNVPPGLADLVIEKTGPSNVINVGNPMTYVVTVRNNGPDSAIGVMMTDILDEAFTFVSATSTQGSCTETAGKVRCSLGDLTSNAVATVTITGIPTIEGGINNASNTFGDQVDPLLYNNEATYLVTAVIASNVSPVANAGPDQTVAVGSDCRAAVNLDGTGSSDPDKDELTFTWTGSFGTIQGPTPTINLSLGTHTIKLTVEDGKGGVSTDTVEIKVEDKKPKVSGGAYFYPESSTYRASFSMDLNGSCPPSGWLKYYYTRMRMNFVSTGISSVSVSGSTAIIAGSGIVNGSGDYRFIATVTNGSPDNFSIVIKKSGGSPYYSAGPKNISGGDLVIQ